MSSDFDIIVAGSGVAGLSAALTAARAGQRVLVMTGDTLGGHLLSIEKIDGCPGFPEGAAGYDYCPSIQEQAAEAGAEFAMEAVESLSPVGDSWRVTGAAGERHSRAVIVATGTRLRSLGVPGEDLLRGKGVSQCASCDAPLMRGQTVAVAGGGDSAMQEALTLAEHCGRVIVVHHGDRLVGQAAYVAQVSEHGRIDLQPDSEIVEIVGAESVTGVRIRELGSGNTSEQDCTGVFVFVGLDPTSAIVPDAARDAHGYVSTDARFRTSLPGLLAAGTVRAGASVRAASAAGEGASAAISADAFLRGDSW